MADTQSARIVKIVVGLLQANCYVIADADSNEAIIIDPGADARRIRSVITKNGFIATRIVNTHGHADHIGANEALGYPVLIHGDDRPFLAEPALNLSSTLGGSLILPTPKRLLRDGDIIRFGSSALTVMHTPGHTPGSICLKTADAVFTGDTLFAGGVGRTDFPYGDEHALLASIKERLMTLEDDLTVYPGHGPASTIGIERTNNPFLSRSPVP